MSHKDSIRPVPALFHFHLRVGVRVALRAAAPLVVLPVLAIGLSPEPSRWPAEMGRALLLPEVDPLLPVAATLAALGLSAWASRRMSLSAGSWIRHLPAGEDAHRRAGILGLAAAQLPLWLILAVLWTGPRMAGDPVSFLVLVSWVAASLSAGAALWPSRRRRWLAPVAAAGAVAGFAGTWWGAGAALAAVLAVDRLGGPAMRTRRGRLRHVSPRWPLDLKMTVRALGWRMVAAQATPLAILALTALATANNEAASEGSGMAARLGATLGLAFLMAKLAHLMAVRRPPWPWVRSLPQGAAARIRRDALFMIIQAIPLVAAAAWIDLRAAIGLAALAPVLALVAVGEMRSDVESHSMIPVRAFAAGLFVALLHGLLAWVPAAGLLALPLLLSAAVSRDRAARVTRWREGGHLAEGDSLSWSGG